MRFSGEGNTETRQSAKATAEHAGSFGALARANGWYNHATVTDPIAMNLRRRLNQRRRARQNYLAPVREVSCGKITRTVGQQNALVGVTTEEKASLGASW
jgi:hypothetical protein